MTESKQTVINRYIEGGTRGTASRFEIKLLNGYRCIVGYGWAIYAAYPIDGEYVLFGDGYKTDSTNVGWAGYSGTTTQHIQEIKSGFEVEGAPYTVADTRPTTSDLEQDAAYDLPTVVEENEVEPLDTTGYYYRQVE